MNAVHLMNLKDEVYDGTNHCAHPDAYVNKGSSSGGQEDAWLNVIKKPTQDGVPMPS